MSRPMIWVADHSLCVSAFGKVFLARPCNGRTGRFTFNGNAAPWFRLSRFTSKSTASVWHLFVVPFFCVGVVQLAR